MASSQGELKRGWRPLTAAAIGTGLGISPVAAYTTGVFALPLSAEFGWSRSEVLAVTLIQTLAFMFVAPFVGRLSDKVGPRPVVIGGILGLGLTTAAFSLIGPSIWSYYGIYAAMIVVALGTMPPVFAKVINSWFDRKRGLALGIALSSTGVAGVFLPVYVQTLIDMFGWRTAYVGLGLLPLVIALPVVLFFLPNTGPKKEQEAPGVPTHPQVEEGLSISEALRTYRYWLLAVLGLVAGAGLSGVVINFVPMLVDKGFTAADAARYFSLFGAFVIVGRLVFGYLLDRFWGPAVGCVFLLGPMMGTLMLTSSLGSTSLILPAILLVALASGGEFDLIAYLTSRYFGRRNFSALYAGQYGVFAVGAGVAPAVFGIVYDQTGSYDPALIVCSVLFGASSLTILTLGRYPDLSQWRQQQPATG